MTTRAIVLDGTVSFTTTPEEHLARAHALALEAIERSGPIVKEYERAMRRLIEAGTAPGTSVRALKRAFRGRVVRLSSPGKPRRTCKNWRRP